jgi:phenylacetate-CoA ligase
VSDQADRQAIARGLVERIKTMVGVTSTVNVGGPDTIERTLVGKARRVIDRRPR